MAIKLSPSHSLSGIEFVLLSAVGLAAQNVVLRLFFSSKDVIGLGTFGGFVPDNLSNILCLLALRTTCMMVMLAIAAPLIYGPTFTDIRNVLQTPRLRNAVLSGGTCSIIGLAFLYAALSQLPAGVAIATFFLYPAITVLLAWRLFHQRPSTYQLGVMGVILSGVFLLNWVPESTTQAADSSSTLIGFICAVLAALGFALYGIFSEMVLRPHPLRPHLHPVPFSLSVFLVGSVFSGGATMLLHVSSQPLTIPREAVDHVLVMTLICAGLTLVAHVLNNFGVRYIGAALASLIAALVPSLTAMFAWGILNETLLNYQMIGIGIITLGVAALSLKVSALGQPQRSR